MLFVQIGRTKHNKMLGEKQIENYIYSAQIMIAYKGNLLLQYYDFNQNGIKDENL